MRSVCDAGRDMYVEDRGQGVTGSSSMSINQLFLSHHSAFSQPCIGNSAFSQPCIANSANFTFRHPSLQIAPDFPMI